MDFGAHKSTLLKFHLTAKCKYQIYNLHYSYIKFKLCERDYGLWITCTAGFPRGIAHNSYSWETAFLYNLMVHLNNFCIQTGVGQPLAAPLMLHPLRLALRVSGSKCIGI
jgi:hypothetical protein